MKKILLIFAVVAAGVVLNAQQTPLSENYFLDKYMLAPSYAGNFNPKFVFTGYRSDWSGIDGGPKTLSLSYNDLLSFMNNAGFGAKLVFDKAGIFNQLYIMGSYSYKVKLVNDHFLMFGISAGLYNNTINLSEYYNDPDYAIDPSLINENISSRVKFMTDFSIVYNWKNLDAGVLFSNISFGDASYKEVSLKYNPVANFMFHTSYDYDFSQNWTLTPLVIIRGGIDIKSQFEFAARIRYIERVWASALFRDPGIIGFGIGGKVVKGLYIGYNFNLATNVELAAFNSHEVTLGVNIGEYLGKK